MHNISQNACTNNPYSLNVGGRLIEIDRPCVMGIVNVTDDSFWEASRVRTAQDIEKQVEKHITHGASIIDIGGYSTRPGASVVEQSEELKRLMSAVQAAKRVDENIILSIDTFRSEVVRRVYEEYGAFIVNDISGGMLDDKAMETAAAAGIPYIIGHIKGTPQTMAQNANYDEPILNELLNHFTRQIAAAHRVGIKDIVIDPCFGFAKTVGQNYSLLKRYNLLTALGYPVMAALSRKSMIYKPLNVGVEDALIGTAALHFEALRQGATILRAHDVREAIQIITLYEEYENAY